MNKFGKALREQRKKLGMTLRDVEEKSRISRQSVLRAERGLHVSLDVALRLFDALKFRGPISSTMLNLYLAEHVLNAKKRVKAAAPKKKAKAQRERPSK